MSTLEGSIPHKLARATVDAAGSVAQSFTPINQICQHVSGIHCYAHDLTRQVIAEHYCTHVHGSNMHQCIIFDSDRPDARLIGIEYIVNEATFSSLSAEEKRYWHSHDHEVTSGMLTVVQKAGLPRPIVDTAERPVLQDLRRTYGKTIHTWQYDIYPDLPLGLPQFMMALTKDGMENKVLVQQRDEAINVSTADKRKARAQWLDPPPGGYKKIGGADGWEITGESVQLEVKTVKMKMD